MASFTYTGLQRGDGKEVPLRNVQEFVDVESSDSGASSDEASDARTSARRRTPNWVWLSVAGLALVVVIGYLTWLHVGGHASRAGRKEADVDFGEKVLIPSTPSEATATMTELTTSPPNGAFLGSRAFFPRQPAGGAGGDASLEPAEDLHDGNVCQGNEELFEGLCYKKCTLLTGGQDAIRTSPWTCCEQHPCTTNQKLSIAARVACSGYAVAGDGSCPHKPGACLKDEELYLGVCYKKCSILTEMQFPYRVAPATCCKGSSLLDCLDFRKDYTSGEFAVGGGEANTGACLEDEELLLGQCYKKCSLLTNNEYPLRTTAATCCKAHSKFPYHDDGVWHLGCLDPRKDKTSAAFNIAGDRRDEAVALADAHYPLQNLTEAKASDAVVHA
uniref:Uncharacterized protein n=1 Tax=Alexandrium monilatum TaxID=311494 RepID=A0A7S4QU91_9DINO